LPDTTGPDTGKVSATINGTATATTTVPSRILRLTGYINASGTVSYARNSADEKNKIQEFFAKLAFMKCLGIGHARVECAETAHARAVFNLKAL